MWTQRSSRRAPGLGGTPGESDHHGTNCDPYMGPLQVDEGCNHLTGRCAVTTCVIMGSCVQQQVKVAGVSGHVFCTWRFSNSLTYLTNLGSSRHKRVFKHKKQHVSYPVIWRKHLRWRYQDKLWGLAPIIFLRLYNVQYIWHLRA